MPWYAPVGCNNDVRRRIGGTRRSLEGVVEVVEQRMTCRAVVGADDKVEHGRKGIDPDSKKGLNEEVHTCPLRTPQALAEATFHQVSQNALLRPVFESSRSRRSQMSTVVHCILSSHRIVRYRPRRTRWSTRMRRTARFIKGRVHSK